MFKRVLVALDGSETSARALNAALLLASEGDAELQPLFIIDVPMLTYDAPGFDPGILRKVLVEEGQRVTGEAQDRMHAAHVRGVTRTAETNPLGESIAERIVLCATEFKADVVVIGTHGRRGFQRLVMGSVAERFVRIARCAVLLIPADHAAGVHHA